MMFILSSVILVVIVTCNPVANAPSGVQYVPPNSKTDNPVFNMFRNFASSFPPYANPMNYIPPQAFPASYGPPGGYINPYMMGNNPFIGGQGFNPAFGYSPPQSINGMGYAGPFVASGYGQADPAYANVGGNRNQPTGVPVLNTRLAGTGQQNSQDLGGTGTSVVKTDDGQYAHVSVQHSPDGKPIYRSQTIQGPNSYGTAFAYSSG